MNWLLIISAGLLILLGLHGYYKGFIKKVFSLVALILSITLVSLVSPYISDFLQYQTPVYNNLQEKCAEILYVSEGAINTTTEAGQNQLIESSYLPGSIKTRLEDNNNPNVYQVLGATGFNDYVGGYMASLIINAIAFVVAFLLISIVIRIIIKVLDIIAKLPVLNGINRFAGLLVGIVQALLVIWIGFVVITIFSNTDFGRMCFGQINDSILLSALYDNNILMEIVSAFL